MLALAVEDLEPMVEGIGDDEVAVLVDGDLRRPAELAVLVAFLPADDGERRAVLREDLDALVAGVGDDEAALAVDCGVARAAELPGLLALGADRLEELELGGEDEHAMVVRVGDVEAAGGVEADAFGVAELGLLSEGRRGAAHEEENERRAASPHSGSPLPICPPGVNPA